MEGDSEREELVLKHFLLELSLEILVGALENVHVWTITLGRDSILRNMAPVATLRDVSQQKIVNTVLISCSVYVQPLFIWGPLSWCWQQFCVESTSLVHGRYCRKMLNKTCNQIQEDCKTAMFYVVLKWTVTLRMLLVLVMYTKSSDQIKEKCLCRNWQTLFSYLEKAVYLLETIGNY